MICQSLTREQSNALYLEVLESKDTEALRRLCREDLFFLLTVGCKRKDIDKDWLYDRCREVERNTNGMLDLWARDHYKDIDINEVVPTPTGWKNHGDLKVGDWVYHPSGNPVEVVAITQRYTDAKCFRITFDDGYSLVCGSGHLWEVEKRSRKRVKGEKHKRLYREKVVMATHEIAALKHEQDDRLSIPVSKPLLNIEHILPVEPYVLGLWLGDGTSDSGAITNADFESWENIKASGYDIGNPVGQGKGIAETRTIYGIRPMLRELGILNNKHIPRSYAWSCEKQRRALLQGLMDSDGHCSDKGTATFCNQNERLIDDVFDLCQSLGLKARKFRYEGEKKPYWQVTFQAYKADAPFRIKRKLDRCFDGERKNPRRYIVSVEQVETVETSCIQVDSKDGLYLVGRNLITTHNSTIITYGLTIQDILKNPEWTFGIFSHTRPIAKAFLKQIKTELETNSFLKGLFPEILFQNPESESPSWSLDAGITVKRKSNPKENTIEAYGLVDGQPTSKHFTGLIYDDVVTIDSVTTPEQIKKTTAAWEMSTNLGSNHGGFKRFIGTRYHANDTWSEIIKKGSAIPRIHRATDNGKIDGNPVFLTPEKLAEKKKDMGPYTFGSQMLQDPVADKAMGFKEEWWKDSQTIKPDGMNLYLLVDPASKKKKSSDYTVMVVVGLAPDGNYYIVDGIRDRLNLVERAQKLFSFHRKYKPKIIGYEEYGLQADVEHAEEKMEQDNYRFAITRMGGSMAKDDRIKRLIPLYFQKRMIIANRIHFVDYEGKAQNFTELLKDEEFKSFPVSAHDDMLDCISRIFDINAEFPKEQKPIATIQTAPGGNLSWMG